MTLHLGHVIGASGTKNNRFSRKRTALRTDAELIKSRNGTLRETLHGTLHVCYPCSKDLQNGTPDETLTETADAKVKGDFADSYVKSQQRLVA